MSEQSTNGPSEGAGSTSSETPQGDLPPPPPPPPPSPSSSPSEAAVNAEVEEMWSKPLGPPATVPPPPPESSGGEPEVAADDEAAETESTKPDDGSVLTPDEAAAPESAPAEAEEASGDVPWQVPNPTPPWSEEPAAPPASDPAAVQLPPPPPAPPPAPADGGWAAQQDPAQQDPAQQWQADPAQQQWQQDPSQQQWQADPAQQQWQGDPAQQQWQQDPSQQQWQADPSQQQWQGDPSQQQWQADAAQQQWQQDPAAAAQAYQQAPVAPQQTGSGQYPAYGYPQAQVPAPGYPAGPQAPQFVDPHGVGQAVTRLGSAGKRNGKMSFHILAALLDTEETVEVVEILVAGRVRGVPGAAALVGNKVILVNERSWKPDVVTVQLDAALQVQGWQDDKVASLMFAGGEGQEVIERIPDRLLAVEFAQRVRDRIANPV